MRRLVLFTLVIFVFSTAITAQTSPPSNKFHNKIDEVQTAADIKKLLDGVDAERSQYFAVSEKLQFEKPECQELVTGLKANSWEKADFDGNGYTDLLVSGSSGGDTAIIVIMDDGGNKFSVKGITNRSFQVCAVAVVDRSTKTPTIEYQSADVEEARKTLIYRFGDFVEVGGSGSDHKIERIEYETSGCFGTCPIFELKIKADGSATYHAIRYNKRKGNFKGVITRTSFDQLAGLLNNIDFPNLKDKYAVGWTDDEGSTLTITYDNGKVKKIGDYGMIGTSGLARVYEMLFELRENQVWK